MSHRATAEALARSPAAAFFGARRNFHRVQSVLSLLNPFKGCRTRSCSSAADDLSGLVDPEIVEPWNDGSPQDLQEGAVSMKDFAFLQEASDGGREVMELGNVPEEAVLMAKAVRVSQSDFSGKTEKILRQFRQGLNENLVIEVLRLVKVPELAIGFFLWAGRQIGYNHTGRTYDALIDCLGFDYKKSIPQKFLEDMGQEDREALGRLLNALVRKCCLSGFWNEALEELGKLKDFGYRPSKATYNALLHVLLCADRLDTAFLVHREMSDSGLCLDKFVMGRFAYALCKAGRWVEALNLIEKEDFNLDTILCTQMISGLLEASLFEEAISFLHRMRSSSCIPNVVTYRTLLSGFLQKKQLGWCKRIINMMITEGCNPSPSLFNSLMHGYCSTGDYSYAYKLLKKMSSCGCPPGYVTYNIFIGGICGNGLLDSEMLDLAEKAYDEMLSAGIVLNKVNIGNFARSLCYMGKFDKVFLMIKEMMKRGFVPDTSTYSKVIGFLCESSKVEKAFLLFLEMKNNGIVPDVYTYTILIDSFCKVGLIEQADKWFEEMKRNGCTPNVVTYTTLIHAYLKSKHLSKANELFQSMINMGCVPNVVTYTSLIDGLCKAGQVEEACVVYAKMRGSSKDLDTNAYFEGSNDEIIEPNVFTYGALVDGLCKAHKVVEAQELLSAMKSAGCEPNHVVYDALIDGFCKVGKLEEAQKVFIRMSEHGYTPNVYTYSSLIDRLFKDKRLDLALKVLSKMLESSCAPNVITYTEMIDGLCKVGKTEEAYKLLKMMEEKGSNPNVITYTALIDGYGKEDKVDMCLKLFDQMTAKGCSPNFITYRILINHCCTAGFLDEALRLLEEMKQTYWPRHLSGYRNVIQGFSKKFITSLGLLDEMTHHNSIPIAPAYIILIDNLSKAGRLETAIKLHEEIRDSLSCSSNSNRNMYAILIEGLCLSSKIDKAFQLYSEMLTRGHVPDLNVLFSLIKGLLRMKMWDEALQLLYSIYHMDIDWHKGKVFDGS